VDPGLVRRLGDMCRVAAGLSDVHQRIYRIPIGSGALGRMSSRGTHRGRSASLSSHSSISLGDSSNNSGNNSPPSTSPRLALTAHMAKEILAKQMEMLTQLAIKHGMISEKDVQPHLVSGIRDE